MRVTRLTLPLAAALLVSLPIAHGTAQVKLTTSTGDVVIFSEKNLTNHMIVSDSIELEMAELAVSRTQNAAVKSFAEMLVTEHRGHLESVRKIAGEDDVGRQPSTADTTAAAAIRALTTLRTMAADSGFDSAFVREQLRFHNEAIIAMKMLGGAADDDDLEDEVKKTLPMLERHLARAREVAATLGMQVDTTGVKTDTTKVDTTARKPTTSVTKPPRR